MRATDAAPGDDGNGAGGGGNGRRDGGRNGDHSGGVGSCNGAGTLPLRVVLWGTAIGLLGVADVLVVLVGEYSGVAATVFAVPGPLGGLAELPLLIAWKGFVVLSFALVVRYVPLDDEPWALAGLTLVGLVVTAWNASIVGSALGPTDTRMLLEGLVQTAALSFGVVWLVVNTYVFYPLVRVRIGSPGNGDAVAADGGDSDSDAGDAVAADGGDSDSDAGDAVAADGGDEWDGLPSIDVLVPAYHEGPTVAQAIGSIRGSEYPDRLLTVTVLVEPDDETTRAALADLADSYEFETVVVPAEYPGEQTKPRALNYGFARTDGDLVGVIDAEDVVDERLFHRVAETVGPGPDGADYAQGALDMVNEGDGLTNALFRGEYGFWFRLVLPAFGECGYPVPLGGSTNFFRRETLEAASRRRREWYPTALVARTGEWQRARELPAATPWDPANVTEDFELGLLLWRAGLAMGYLGDGVVTREESPTDLANWITQRTRWQKGKLYTLWQALRHPPAGLRTKGHYYLQSSMPHLGAINLVGVVFVFLYANAAGVTLRSVPGGALLVSAAFLLVLLGVQGYSYRRASDERDSFTRWRRTALNVLALPGYWLLQWGADLRAMNQSYRGRFHWEKTDHELRTATAIFERLVENGDADLDPATVGEILFVPRRRRVLEHLQETGGHADLQSLTDALLELEPDEGPPRTARKNLYLSLRHTHLPFLDACSMVEYDRERQVVRTPALAEPDARRAGIRGRARDSLHRLAARQGRTG